MRRIQRKIQKHLSFSMQNKRQSNEKDTTEIKKLVVTQVSLVRLFLAIQRNLMNFVTSCKNSVVLKFGCKSFGQVYPFYLSSVRKQFSTQQTLPKRPFRAFSCKYHLLRVTCLKLQKITLTVRRNYNRIFKNKFS